MEETKKMRVLYANTIRELIGVANESEIKKNDIVSLIKESGIFILVYYK